MSEPTSTRKDLRRGIARAERLDFQRRYSDGEISLTGTPTTSALPSTSLTQSDNHWRNGWVYIASGTQLGKDRRITAFSASNDTLQLEHPLTQAPVAGDKIEIYEIWPPSQIHECINRAIEKASRYWPETVIDSTLTLREDTLRYSLTGLTKTPYRFQRAWIERVGNSVLGTISEVSSDATNITITVSGFTPTADQYNGYKIAIYDGTGRGIGTVDDTTTTALVVTLADFATAPVAGDKFRIWDENYQTHDFFEMRNLHLDAPDWPDILYLEKTYPEYYGCRLHLQYISLPSALSLDTDTTTVPREFIVHQARALLHEDLMGDNRSDANRHGQLATYFQQKADEYAARFYAQRPGASQFVQDNIGMATSDDIDPLDWGSA